MSTTAKSDLLLLAAAVLGTAATFFEIRTPGSFGMWPYLFSLLGIVILMIRSLAAAIARRKLPWSTGALLAACVLGPMAGRSWGLQARDRQFLNWRLPVYKEIVARIDRTPSLSPTKAGMIRVDLVGREREVAFSVEVWRFESGERIIRFNWAATGPPPKHWFYVYCPRVETNTPTADFGRDRRVADDWYEVRD